MDCWNPLVEIHRVLSTITECTRPNHHWAHALENKHAIKGCLASEGKIKDEMMCSRRRIGWAAEELHSHASAFCSISSREPWQPERRLRSDASMVPKTLRAGAEDQIVHANHRTRKRPPSRARDTLISATLERQARSRERHPTAQISYAQVSLVVLCYV